MTTSRTFRGSPESMRQLRDGEVALTLAAPPAYPEPDHDTAGLPPQRRGPWAPYEEYLARHQRIFRECYRVTRPGGFCAIVCASVIHNQKRYPLPFDLFRRITDLGWRPHHEVVWHRSASADAPSAAFVIVVRKCGFSSDTRRDAPSSQPAAIVPGNAVHSAEAFPRVHGTSAGTGFLPEELVKQLVVLYTDPGDLVLDPFGPSATAQIAIALERCAATYEPAQDARGAAAGGGAS